MTSCVKQLDNCIMHIQYKEGKKTLEVLGGNDEWETIECPHFNKGV